MLLVDDEVAHGEVGAGVYLLAHGLFAALLAAQAGAHDLGIRQDGEAQGGVLQARREASGAYEALARPRQAAGVLRGGGPHALFPEHFREDIGPAHVPGQQQHAAAVFKVLPGVLRRLPGGAGVGGQLLCRYARDAGRGQGIAPRREGVGHVQRKAREGVERLLLAEAEIRGLCGHAPGAAELFHVALQLLCVFPDPVHEAPGLVQHHQRALRRVVEGAGPAGVDEARIAVRRAQLRAVFEPLRVLREGPGEAGVASALGAGGELFELCGQLGGPAPAERGQGLRGGQDAAALQALGAALARSVEAGYGVYLVPPELHAQGLGLGGGEEIEYAAAAGKLARPLDLGRAGVAAAQQGVLRVPGFEAAFEVYVKGRAAEVLRRHGALKQALSGYNCISGAAEQLAQGAEAALLRLAGDGVRRDEDELAPRQERGPLPREGGEVPGQCLGRGLVRGQQQDAPPGPEPQGRRKLRPVHAREPRYERRKAAPIPRQGEGGSLGYVEKGLCQNAHVHNHCIIAEPPVKFNNIRPSPGRLYYYLIKYLRPPLQKKRRISIIELKEIAVRPSKEGAFF